MKKKIAWIIPAPEKGSGGIKTVINNANYLANNGYICDLYVSNCKVKEEILKERIKSYYGVFSCNVYNSMHYDEAYDIVFSTLSYDTPDIARNFKKAKKIAY